MLTAQRANIFRTLNPLPDPDGGALNPLPDPDGGALNPLPDPDGGALRSIFIGTRFIARSRKSVKALIQLNS